MYGKLLLSLNIAFSSCFQKVTLRIDKCSYSQIVEDDGKVVEDRSSCEIEGEIWGSSM